MSFPCSSREVSPQWVTIVIAPVLLVETAGGAPLRVTAIVAALTTLVVPSYTLASRPVGVVESAIVGVGAAGVARIRSSSSILATLPPVRPPAMMRKSSVPVTKPGTSGLLTMTRLTAAPLASSMTVSESMLDASPLVTTVTIARLKGPGGWGPESSGAGWRAFSGPQCG